MSLLTVSSLAKSHGPVDIFAGVSFSLPARGRYAIVGPNGVGKTTLLRILAGEEEASGGVFHFARGLSVGYLKQEAAVDATHSLWEECLTAFTGLRAQEAALEQFEAEMSAPGLPEAQLEALMERYGALQAEFDHSGGYTYAARIRQVLGGLGFDEADLQMPLPQLSGGQRTRAVLARLLLAEPDLLLLDEPTNHLDIAAVEWLEAYLKDWKGAALLVSHDRYFIDRIATHILEMHRGSMETYRGNYSAYLRQREERWNLRQEFFEAEKARLEKELDYIKRNIAGQNVSQAKGKLRRLSRYLEAVEQLGFEGVRGKAWAVIAEEADYGSPMGVAEAESRIKNLQGPRGHGQALRLRLSARQRSGKIVLRTQNLQVGYPGAPLFTAPEIELTRLECAAIIGPNGSGKSTFLKTLLGQLPPLAGEITLGASLDVAYFAQAHEDLDPTRTLMEEIDAFAPMLPAQIRSYLARFQFTGDEAYKPISVLSGGERGRLALAKLSLTAANLLLLDEPTNHLDLPSQEILQEVVSEFQGTILLVSHDRYLIDALATQIWEIDPRRKEMAVFEGTYAEYRASQLPDFAPEGIAAPAKAVFAARKAPPAPQKVRDTREKNRAHAEDRRRKHRLHHIETEITALETRLAALVSALESPPPGPAEVQKLGEEYVTVQQTLEDLMWEWEELHA